MKRNAAWSIVCAALAALLGWLVVAWQPEGGAASVGTDALPAGGDFTLYGADGPFRLADQRGKIVVLYFGYTFCPDVCPSALTLLGQALSTLEARELERVVSVMVSLDPERDTAEVLKVYAPFFHPTLIGVSGTAQQVAQVAAQYGVRYMKQKPDANGLYSVDHSAYTYFIASDGKLAARLPHGAPPEDIVRTLRTLLPAG